jgi:TIR domain
MEMGKIFFSYARADSEFVLKLAEDLRSNDVNLWLDQLDIPGGVPWDDAVEEALHASQCLLVILSPVSVTSNNVKDEISFGLEKRKDIVPVLYKDCTIPFRLRRLQYIDFRVDYDDGFKRLVQTLTPVDQLSTGQRSEEKAERIDKEVPSPWRTYGPVAAVAAVVLIIFSFVFLRTKEPTKDPVNGPVQSEKKQKTPPIVDKSPFPGDIARAAYFFDDFAGNKLTPYWKVLDSNPSKWTLQSNKSSLLIITEGGSISGSFRNLKNQFVLDRSMPKRNYEVIAKASFQIQGTLNSISIALFRDDENFLELSYWGQPTSDTLFSGGRVYYDFYRTVSFIKEEGGQRKLLTVTKDKAAKGPSDSPELLLLKIERDGNQYTGYYAPFSPARPPQNIDDVSWLKIGAHALIDFDGKLSLWANNGNANIYQKGPPPEVAAEFDFVLVRER